MTSYKPNVQCRKHDFPPPADRCKRLIDVMLVSTKQQYWGKLGHRYQRPDVLLPKYLRERQCARKGICLFWLTNRFATAADHKCIILISTTGSTDLTSWHAMWEAASAIYSMCIRLGQFGTAEGIGQKGYLTLKVAPGKTPSAVTEE
ncbi:MAG: hypothetical protein L6R35_002352 [Caloplaca aegaea]|nr:MAG: hypothetical protein L6R35_002352 [Caloplaca aegaea]